MGQGFMVQRQEYRVSELRFRFSVYVSGVGGKGLGFMAQGLGFEVQG